MPLYSKPSEQLVYDLINHDNPGLGQPVSASNTLLGAPTAYSPGSGIANTQIRLSALANSFYIGSKVLSYRRIVISDLFKGRSIEIKKYSAAASNVSPYSLYQLIGDINIQTGLTLTTDDFNDANFPAATDNVYPERTCKATLTFKSTCKAFQGSIDIRWRYDEPYLSNIAPNGDVDGRLYPGGNDFSNGTKYRVGSESFGGDFSAQAANLNSAAFAGSVAIGNASYTAQQQAVVDLLNQITGKTYTINSANQNQPYGLYGAICTRYSIPNAAVPEANSDYFNTVVLITLPDTNTWGVGKLMLHYNT
jgi:hypothetical protein